MLEGAEGEGLRAGDVVEVGLGDRGGRGGGGGLGGWGSILGGVGEGGEIRRGRVGREAG